ncbi:hypothetical protein MF410_28080 (plasmid) [Rhizobium sp. C104]|uniref:hypothetical protein n=1 Tax=Rhizobium sp. C104 TaxID=2917727 RepID=UPI001EF8BA56|nr:hypothetical protein [Rhizobium sp. C104]ULJ81558.1 hypothetical protein MF410_28080 [Rhizobium sp. C104]
MQAAGNFGREYGFPDPTGSRKGYNPIGRHDRHNMRNCSLTADELGRRHSALVAVLNNGTEFDPNLHLHISGMGRRLQRFTSAHDLLSGAQSGRFNSILVDASMADLPV